MIAATVIFNMPQDSDWDALRERAVVRAREVYVALPGLHTKAFVLNAETKEYGGMYIFDTQADLDTFLKSNLITAAAEKLGQPAVRVYEVPAFIEDGKLQ